MTKAATKERAAFKLASNIQDTWEIKLWQLRAAAAAGTLIDSVSSSQYAASLCSFQLSVLNLIKAVIIYLFLIFLNA